MTTSTTNFGFTGSTVIWTVTEYVKPGSNLNWVIADAGTLVSGGVTYPGGNYPALANALYDVTVDSGGHASVTYITVDAPLAPTASGPPANQWVDLSLGTTFQWVYNPGPDSGTESGWILRVVVNGRTWYWQNDNQTWDDAPSVNTPMLNQSGVSSLTVPGTAWNRIASDGQQITWSVLTTESYYNLPSPYSTPQTFIAGAAASGSVSSVRAVMSVNNSVTAAVSDSSSDQAQPTKSLATGSAVTAASATTASTGALSFPAGVANSQSIIANPIEFLFAHTIIGSSNSTSLTAIDPTTSEVITGGPSISFSYISNGIDVATEFLSGTVVSVSSARGMLQTPSSLPTGGLSISTTASSVSRSLEVGYESSVVTDSTMALVFPSELIEITAFVPLQRGIGMLGSATLGQFVTGSDLVPNANLAPPTQSVVQAQATVVYFVTGSSTSTSTDVAAETERLPSPQLSSVQAVSSAQAQTTMAALRTITRAISQSASTVTDTPSSSEVVVTAHSLSVSWAQASLASILNVFIQQADTGTGVDTQAAPSIRAALLNHLLDQYVVPDVKPWEIENERARHDQALYRLGEYAVFVLLWTVQDFEAHLVGRCRTCYVPAEPVADTWKQAAYFKCPDCLGTTFEGGYKALIVRPSMWTWDEPKQQQQERGVVNTNVATVQTTADFRMQPKDYIIRGDGSRWQVQQVEGTHLDTGFGTQSGIWDATQFTYTNVTREDESSPIYLLPLSEQFIQQAVPQYYSRAPVTFS